MSAPLTVKNAELHTATVEINTLTVSGKQVTLAVFRQLEEKPLIGEGEGLNGLPWGRVNYHPEGCGPTSDEWPHMHVVWQEGSELRRSKVYLPMKPDDGIGINREDLDAYAQARFCMLGHDYDKFTEAGFSECKPGRNSRFSVAFELHGMKGWGGAWPKYCASWRCQGEEKARERAAELWRGFRKEIREERERIARETEKYERQKKQWDALDDLPQLFIAV